MGAVQDLERVGIAPSSGQASLQAGRCRPAAHPREYLSFRLGAEEHGLDILKVQETCNYETAARISGVPKFIKGVTNLRGMIVPIVGLRMNFGQADFQYAGNKVTIVRRLASRVFGAVVDSVSDVIELKPEQIHPAPPTAGGCAEHILGLGTVRHGDKERMPILVDIELLMCDPGMGLLTSRSQDLGMHEAQELS